MRVAIIFRPGYNERNYYWYFKPGIKETIYEVKEHNEEQYLVLNPPDPEYNHFIQKSDSEVIED